MPDPATPAGYDPGSVEADELVRRHTPALRRFCLARTSDAADADDAVQETLLHLVRHLRRERIENPEAWLIAVASRVCRRIVARRTRFRSSQPAVADVAADPEELVVQRSWVRRILEGLEAGDRAVLASLYLNDEAATDLAASMGRPEGTVRWLAHRARARARAVAIELGAAALLGALRKLAGSVRSGRARLSAAVSHPQLQATAAGPAWLLLAAATSGLLPGLAPAVASAVQLAPSAGPAAAVPVSARLGGGPLVLRTDAGGPRPPAATSAGAAEAVAASRRSEPSPTLIGPPTDPRDSELSGVAWSPAYTSDHTLFAWGLPFYCEVCSATVLYRSQDSGRSWQLRPAVGYQQGQILLPFDYGQSHVVFAVTNYGLWRSDDDGGVFTMAVPLQGTGYGAAVVPAGAGDSVVVLGGQPLVRYDERTRGITVDPALPAVTVVRQVDYAPSRLLILGDRTTTGPVGASTLTGRQDTVPYLLSCAPDGTGCTAVQAPADSILEMSPDFSADHTLALVTPGTSPVVRLSSDEGRTFASLPVPSEPAGAVVQVWPYLVAHRGLAFALDATWPAPGGVAGTDLESSGSGSGHPVPFGNGVVRTVPLNGIVSLPDGTLLALLAGKDSSGRFGLRCSHDGGTTWAIAC